MPDKIVGMMFAKNEVDVLPFTIPDAFKHVDSLFIADDGSIDGSWEIIKYFKQAYPDKIEYIQRNPSNADKGQRTALLNEIRKRYKPENTWVQIIEADIMVHTTDLRYLIEKFNKEDISVKWHCINAVRDDWTDIHHLYPLWPEPIQKIMPRFHWLESFPVYTYRPLPDLFFSPIWRPWPNGFGKYYSQARWERPVISKHDPKRDMIPLLAHYGYRGPTHLHTKWKLNPNPNKETINKYKWDHSSADSLLKTCGFFNGRRNRNETVWESPIRAYYHRAMESDKHEAQKIS